MNESTFEYTNLHLNIQIYISFWHKDIVQVIQSYNTLPLTRGEGAGLVGTLLLMVGEGATAGLPPALVHAAVLG